MTKNEFELKHNLKITYFLKFYSKSTLFNIQNFNNNYIFTNSTKGPIKINYDELSYSLNNKTIIPIS